MWTGIFIFSAAFVTVMVGGIVFNGLEACWKLFRGSR
jgi:hypothetical protein